MGTFANNRKPWKPDEEAILLEFMRNSDKTLREVSDAMGRTPMAILLRTRILVGIDARQQGDSGVAYMHSQIWSDAEDYYLKTQFLKGIPVNVLANHFDRTPQAVIAHIYKVLTDEGELNNTYQRIKKLRKVSAQESPKIDPFAPGYYRHFKGNYYQLIEVAKHSETLEPMVVYRALYGDRGLWVRPASMWNEIVDKPEYKGPRFVKVEESEVPDESKK